MAEIKTIQLSSLTPNNKNPRTINETEFLELVQSLKDFPEMADVREIVVNKDLLILGGNMRYQAMLEAGWTEAPVKIVDWPEEKQREFIIKDNTSKGQWDWDILANEWDEKDVDEWLGSAKHKDWKDKYDPNLNPSFSTDEVTNDVIEKKARELAKQMVKEQNNIDTICPNCGEEFKLQI